MTASCGSATVKRPQYDGIRRANTPQVPQEPDEGQGEALANLANHSKPMTGALAMICGNKSGNNHDRWTSYDATRHMISVTNSCLRTSICDGNGLEITRNSKPFHPIDQAGVKERGIVFLGRIQREAINLEAFDAWVGHHIGP